MSPCTHEAGQLILAEGEQGSRSGWHVIVDGEVLVSQRAGEGGAEVSLRRLGRGEFFGECSVLRDCAEPSAASVTAVSACVTLRLLPDDFGEVLPPAVCSCLQQFKHLSPSHCPTSSLAGGGGHARGEARVRAEALRPIAVVGRGSFGPVQLCQDTSSGATCVIKVMGRKALTQARQEANAMNEVRLLRDIQHPFVARQHGQSAPPLAAWCPSSAPAPPQGAPSGPKQLGTPRVGRGHWDSQVLGLAALLSKAAHFTAPVHPGADGGVA